MKVPTYHKFGLTKTQLKEVETRDKKISDILTHHLTIGIGIGFGLAIYIIYYNAVRPSTFIQITMQIFLFASMGVLCVGVPAVLFKVAEMYYFKRRENTDEHKTIKAYQEERDEFDFWKIRKDFSFWRILDGLSFEKEVMNLYMHLGYELKEDMFSEENPNDRVIHKDDKNYYLSFNTKLLELSDTERIDSLVKRMKELHCDELLVFSSKGFSKQVIAHAKDMNISLLDINGIIKIVRTVKNNQKS